MFYEMPFGDSASIDRKNLIRNESWKRSRCSPLHSSMISKSIFKGRTCKICDSDYCFMILPIESEFSNFFKEKVILGDYLAMNATLSNGIPIEADWPTFGRNQKKIGSSKKIYKYFLNDERPENSVLAVIIFFSNNFWLPINFNFPITLLIF